MVVGCAIETCVQEYRCPQVISIFWPYMWPEMTESDTARVCQRHNTSVTIDDQQTDVTSCTGLEDEYPIQSTDPEEFGTFHRHDNFQLAMVQTAVLLLWHVVHPGSTHTISYLGT
jgi:hypothetical protein